MGALTPFQREGGAVELTASDYATRSGLTLPQASGALRRLASAGLVVRTEARGRTIYRRADAADMAARRRK